MNPQLKILLVANEENEAHPLQLTLEGLGYEVTGSAITEESVLAYLEHSAPDVILVDTIAATAEANVAIAQAALRKRESTIVYLVDQVTQDVLDKTRNSAHGYIIKPFKEKEIHSAIQLACNNRQQFGNILEDNAWLHTIVNSSRAAMITLDEDLCITFMNDQAREMSGWKDDDFKSVSFDNLFKVNAYASPNKLLPISSLLEQRNAIDNYYTVTNRNQVNFIAQLDINRIKNKANYKGHIVIMRDVTDIQETRKALEASHQRYQELVEQIPDSIYRSTPEGKLLMANPAFVRMLGYDDVEEVLALDIASQIYYLENDRRKVLKSYDRQSVYTTTIRLRKKDGTLIWAEEHGRKVVDEDGETAYYEGVIRDITQRKHTETILKNIAEGVSAETGHAFFKSLVKHLSKSLSIDYAMVCEMVTSDDTEVKVIAQHGMDEVIREGGSFNLENTPCKKVLSGNDFTYYESDLQSLFPKDSDLAVLDANSYMGVPLYDSQRNKIGHLAILDKKPLTTNLVLIENMVRIFAIRASAELERKHFEHKLVVEKERAEEMNRLKTNFLANMSHEIRTPMNSILGFTTLLDEQLNDTELAYFTSRIKKSGERLLTTINDLLDLAKIEASKTELKMGNFNIGEQVELSAGLMNAIAIQKNIQLYATIEDDQVYAQIDVNVLGQILNNTIGNALKFTEKGEVEVIVDRLVDDGQEFARIRVRDTGIGIDKEFLPQVFDEFKQESHGLSRRYEGTGLGLTITKKYVELQNGTISVESTKSVGTTFTILFPLVSQPEAIGIEDHVAVTPRPSKRRQKPKFKILLVEDNDENKDVTTLILKNHFIIDTAADGQSALEQARDSEYSVILMDINLGRGMNGSEVKDAIRQLPNYSEVPVIAITAYAMRGDRDKYLLEGFDDYLAKPFSKDELVNVITNALAGNQVSAGESGEI